MRIGEGGYNGYNPTAMAWEQMAGLVKQKPVQPVEQVKPEVEAGKAEATGQAEEKKVAKRRLGSAVIQVSSTMMRAGDAAKKAGRAPESSDEMKTEVGADARKAEETGQAETVTGTGREELDAWVEKMQMPMEEYWDELMSAQSPQAAESFGAMPKLELFQEGAKKFLRKNLSGMDEAALDERADLATRLALQRYVELKPRQWKQAQVDNARLPKRRQQSEKQLVKGFDERVMHEAFHDMRRSLENLYTGERALKPQNRPEEAMGEDEQIAWRAATEPRKPGTVDLLMLRKERPRREGETADGFFARLKRYTRQGLEREKQLEADDKYYAEQEKLAAEVAEADGEEAAAEQPEAGKTEAKKPEKVVELAEERERLEAVGRRKDLSPDAQAREMEKIIAGAEARVEGLADDDEYKLLAMREINEMRAQINNYRSVMAMVDGAVREAEALREQGITPVPVTGDMASEYNAEGALSEVDLTAQGIINDEMSDEEKERSLSRALKSEMETAQKVELEYRLAEQEKVAAERRYQDAEIQRNYHRDLLWKIQSALRYVRRAMKRGAPERPKVVQFPRQNDEEAQEG